MTTQKLAVLSDEELQHLMAINAENVERTRVAYESELWQRGLLAKTARDRGYTYQAIADRYGVSWVAIRSQLARTDYGA